ncbi:MAG: SGNH/GDSL hydrolase family protein [Oscillospiraceae bacterium]|nr:SGNH/GDSL hydrolase family protein [Oscillospiraceae bacterium]
MAVVKTAKVWLGGRKGITSPIRVSQYDTGWQFQLTVYDGDSIYVGSGGELAVLNGKKANGSAFSVAGTFASGVATFDCPVTITEAVGVTECELRLTSSGETVGTANFDMIVEKAPLSGYYASGEDFSAVAQLIDAMVARVPDAAADWLEEHITNPTNPPIDTSLSVSGAAADAKTVGDNLFDGRDPDDIHLDSMAKFTGAITSSVRELPDNTWIYRLGSALQPLLGSNFSWDLSANVSYTVRKYKPSSTNVRYELSTIGGPVLWTGYETGTTTDIVWRYLPDLFKSVFDGLEMTGTNVTASNLVYTDANALPDNSLVRFGSDVTSANVANLPFYGLPTVIMTLNYSTTDNQTSANRYTACQIAWTGVSSGSPKMAYRTRYSQSSTSWSNWQIIVNEGSAIKPTGISIDSSNYSEYTSTEYGDPDNMSKSCVVRYASSITEEMIPHLPEYGRTWAIMTVRYSPESDTSNAGRYTRLQLAWSASSPGSSDGDRSLRFRVSYSQAASSWGDWYCLQKDDGFKPVYVAIGTSVTRGEIHREGEATTITDYPYPQYIGKINNLTVHNLAQGGTGCVSRGDSGNKQNFMDVITANESLISSANLITIEWGGNDSSILSGRMGNVTDYFKYEDYVNDYEAMKANATELGALNWCINRIYELNQQVTLILINSTGYNRYITATVDKTAGTVSYTFPSDTSWSAKGLAASIELREKIGIPTINCEDGYVMTAYNSAGDDDKGYFGHDRVHMTNAGYLMKARYMAGEIGKFFTH